MALLTHLNGINKKFLFRNILFFTAFFIMLFDQKFLKNILYHDFGFFRLYHVLWLYFLSETLFILIPKYNNYVGHGKHYAKHYRETPYNQLALQRYTHKYNRNAFITALLWILTLLIIAFFYFCNYISQFHLIIITLFFYSCDQFFINIWCPFRAWLVKSKCCNSCRIYNWDRLMIVSPLIFIPSFWSLSLVAVSFLVFIQWEYLHYKYPERFSELSNLNLRCSDCSKTNCKIQKSKRTKKKGFSL